MVLNKITETLRRTGHAFADQLKKFVPEVMEPDFLNACCAKCSSRNLELVEIHENEVEHAFCVFKCKDCGASFILWEDYIYYCWRQITNAQNVIKSQNEKIAFYNKLLQRRSLWRFLRK